MTLLLLPATQGARHNVLLVPQLRQERRKEGFGVFLGEFSIGFSKHEIQQPGGSVVLHVDFDLLPVPISVRLLWNGEKAAEQETIGAGGDVQDVRAMIEIELHIRNIFVPDRDRFRDCSDSDVVLSVNEETPVETCQDLRARPPT